MANELKQTKREHALPDALIHDQVPEAGALADRSRATVGQVIKRGLSDELNDRYYVIAGGVDGRVHYLDIGQGDRTGATPTDAIVRLTPNVQTLSKADETIIEVAAASSGHYTADLHLKHDRSAIQAYAETHVRRLEAIRRATGEVERQPNGTFNIGADYREIAMRYEERLADAAPVKVEVLSTLSPDQQLKRNAATWLDRELTALEPTTLADSGVGGTVRQSLTARTQWLVEEGLVKLEDNGRSTFPRDLTRMLTQRELKEAAVQLSKAHGLTYLEAREGQSIEGKLKGSVDLASGKFAVVEKAREFTLVPWRDVLTRHHLYLDDELSAQLDALASVPGRSKSAIVSDALRQYQKRRATSGADDVVRVRLDRLCAQLDRTQNDLAVVIETLVLQAHRHFQMTAHLPNPDEAMKAKVREKMSSFIAAVGRGLSVGGPSPIAQAIAEAKQINDGAHGDSAGTDQDRLPNRPSRESHGFGQDISI